MGLTGAGFFGDTTFLTETETRGDNWGFSGFDCTFGEFATLECFVGVAGGEEGVWLAGGVAGGGCAAVDIEGGVASG